GAGVVRCLRLLHARGYRHRAEVRATLERDLPGRAALEKRQREEIARDPLPLRLKHLARGWRYVARAPSGWIPAALDRRTSPGAPGATRGAAPTWGSSASGGYGAIRR